jgi:chromosome segregation ATPase
MTVAADHEATVKSREEELKTIATAKKILTESTSGAEEKTYSFIQAVSQTGSSLHTRADLANAEIVSLVKKLAREQHSEALAQLASKIQAVVRYGASNGDDPFEKVKALIKDMIVKLEKEQDSEATEKAYCDEEMAKTKSKKEELDYTIAKLTAKLDKAASKSASLKDEVKTAQAELAKLAKSQAEMDKIRGEEHADYLEAKKDLELGLSGVRKALSVLKEYYGSASSAAALMQDEMMQPAKPEVHEKAGGGGGSIIDILEVV